jgi:hypothetical protein
VSTKPPIRTEATIHGKERLWLPSHVAEWAHCTPEFITDEVRAGRLKAVFLSPHRPRFHWMDIQEWLANKKIELS